MKTIFITGTSRGIGLGLTKQYYQAGWKVLACCRHPEKATELQELAKRSRGNVIIYRLNVIDEENIISLSNTLKTQPIDILLNNAGILGPSDATLNTITTVDWLDVFKTNTIAPLLIVRAFVKHVANSQLKIIANISSIMGSIALDNVGGSCMYRSSKAALNSVTKNLSNELKEKGITVVALHPGWVKTETNGLNATLDVAASARDIHRVLSHISIENSGEFINHNEERFPW